ncbi:MAG: mechanosensitive ion channel family protein [Actinobacteria bacterium]|nr:mechanosensitive ion channel family protein [Actinomycetota bacterium]
MSLASPLLLAQEPDLTTLSGACGEEPGWLCGFVWEVSKGDGELARTADVFFATPARIVLILLVALLLYRVTRRLTDRFVARMEVEVRRRVERGHQLGTNAGTPRAETRRMQRLHAIGGAIRSALGVVIWMTALLFALSQAVDLRPLLAGAGLAGLIIGFGAQNLIRDFLAGVSMLVEDQFGVGDWIEVEKKVGEVENVGLRVTRMRDIDGVVWHIPNGEMKTVGNLTQHWARATLDVPFALDTDIPKARRIVQAVADGMADDREWGQDIIGPPEIWGVQHWGPDGLSLRLVIPTRPLRNWDVNRQLRERLKYAFEREGIRMPAPFLEVGAQRWGEPVRIADGDPPAREPWRGPDDGPRLVDTTDRIPPVGTPRAEPGGGSTVDL